MKIHNIKVIDIQKGPFVIFLFIAAQFVYIYTENYPSIPLISTFHYWLLYSLAGSLTSLLIYLKLRNWSKSNSIVLLIAAIEFYFSQLHLRWKFLIGSNVWSSYSIVFPLLIIIFILLTIRILKKSCSRFVAYILSLSFLILGYCLFKITFHAHESNKLKASTSLRILPNKPNIAFILLDKYASKSVLKSEFNYDNSPFTNEMKRLGFQEIEESRSVYNFTPFSMASIFSMNSLDLTHNKSSELSSLTTAYHSINHNLLTDFLIKNEYQIHNYSIFPFNDIPGSDGQSFYTVGADILTHSTTSATIWRDLSYHLYIKRLFGYNLNQLSSKGINQLNDNLYKTISQIKNAKNQHPVFIYTHLMMPHPPFWVDSTGIANRYEDQLDNQNKQLYISYLKYGNNLVLKYLNDLSKYDQNTITIVMSDHGYNNYPSPTKENTEFKNILFVKGLSSKMPDSVYAHNVFPLILERLYDSTFTKNRDTSIFLME